MKVGSLLKGRARLWVDNLLVTTTTWQELRDVLITTFEPKNRYSRDIVRFREHNYDNTKDIAQFLSDAWVLWRRITKDKLSSDDAVEALIKAPLPTTQKQVRQFNGLAIKLFNICLLRPPFLYFRKIVRSSYTRTPAALAMVLHWFKLSRDYITPSLMSQRRNKPSKRAEYWTMIAIWLSA